MKLLMVPLKVPLALNVAGKRIEFGIVFLGRKVLKSVAVDLNSLMSKSKMAVLVFGKPLMVPLPTIFVLPKPLISKLGIVILPNLPKTFVFICSMAFG